MHEQRLDAVLGAVAQTNAQTVLDLGCGDGDLFLRLAQLPDIEKLVGIDICTVSLSRLKMRLSNAPPARAIVEVRYGSMIEADPALSSFDCAILVETIEHVNPSDLSQLERAVFGQMRPRSVIVTTPNAEFNALLGVPAHRFRHPDHRFEWSRRKFRKWGDRVAANFGYSAAYHDVAGCHPDLGGASQMAVLSTPHDGESPQLSP